MENKQNKKKYGYKIQRKTGPREKCWLELEVEKEAALSESARKRKKSIKSIGIFAREIRAGDVWGVQHLLASGENIEVNIFGLCTPLRQAIKEDSLIMVEFLVNKGADIHQRDFFGRTPLHNAASAGKAGVVIFLLGRGADKDAKDMNDKKAVDYAKENNHMDIVWLLTELNLNKIKDDYKQKNNK